MITQRERELIDQLHADIDHDCHFTEGWCSSYDKIIQLVEVYTQAKWEDDNVRQ
jgi:hypothetical protein